MDKVGQPPLGNEKLHPKQVQHTLGMCGLCCGYRSELDTTHGGCPWSFASTRHPGSFVIHKVLMYSFSTVLDMNHFKCIRGLVDSHSTPKPTHSQAIPDSAATTFGKGFSGPSGSASASGPSGGGASSSTSAPASANNRVAGKSSPAMKKMQNAIPSGLEIIIRVMSDGETWVRGAIWTQLSNTVWHAHSSEYAGMRSGSDMLKYYRGYNKGMYLNKLAKEAAET